MLSAAQIEARRGKLTASRVACLMAGDREKILRLWLELTDDPAFEPEDLSAVWPVRLGEATEALNLEWFERKTGNHLIWKGHVAIHGDHDWAAATLDGFCQELNCPVEVKHVGGREPLEVIVERYQPQIQWQMEVTGSTQCALSVIMGASEPIIEFIDRDDDYAAEMVRRGAQFMQHVRDKTPPVVLDAVAAPVVADKTYDMGSDNVWGDQAAVWIATKPIAVRCADAEKILKGRVPADAKKCVGHDVQITRDRAGRLSLREVVQ